MIKVEIEFATIRAMREKDEPVQFEWIGDVEAPVLFSQEALDVLNPETDLPWPMKRLGSGPIKDTWIYRRLPA